MGIQMQFQWEDYESALEWLTEINREMIGEGVWKIQSLFSSACIYRVPEELRKLKESAYTPRLIATGPLHRNDKHLQTPIQHVKSSYTNNLFCRLTDGIGDPKSAKTKKIEVLRSCLEKMLGLIADAKKCYAEEVIMDERMMLLDGCFILELLCRSSLQPKGEENPIEGEDSGKSKRPLGREESIKSCNSQKTFDPIFDSILTSNTIRHDLLLLENQIPFFVLEELFKLTVAQIPSHPREYSLTDYVSLYFDNMMNPENNSKEHDTATATATCSLPSVGRECVWTIFLEESQTLKTRMGRKYLYYTWTQTFLVDTNG